LYLFSQSMLDIMFPYVSSPLEIVWFLAKSFVTNINRATLRQPHCKLYIMIVVIS